jgi:hypothetical protein
MKPISIKVLAVLVNYGDEQISYLEKVVKELKSFDKYNVTVIVNSNIPLHIADIDKVNVIELEDYQLLPLTCRKTIWENKDKYDVFIYGENDHLFKELHIDKHLEYEQIIPDNRITGLIQYEEILKSKYFPGYHLDYDWDYSKVEEYNGLKFAHFKNLHQASFILSKDQLLRVGEKIDFNELVDDFTLRFHNKIFRKLKKLAGIRNSRINIYSVKCKVNTDIFKYGGLKKIICISEFEENLIHHLPNVYIHGEKGRKKLRSSQNRMEDALKRLLS